MLQIISGVNSSPLRTANVFFFLRIDGNGISQIVADDDIITTDGRLFMHIVSYYDWR